LDGSQKSEKGGYAMKIQITGNAFVVTSALTVKDIQAVAKNAPDKLKIKDEEGNVLFAVSYNESHPSLSNFGIAFGGKTRDEKALATLTGTIPNGTADAKEFVADKISGVVAYLEQLEKSIPESAKALEEARKKLIGSITEA
jgi:dissimilatory sulfite reductase (desulfoviridin) alpha/beta subunit